jgi:hypothetical protein
MRFQRYGACTEGNNTVNDSAPLLAEGIASICPDRFVVKGQGLSRRKEDSAQGMPLGGSFPVGFTPAEKGIGELQR